MIKGHQACVKQILDKFVSGIYQFIGYLFIFALFLGMGVFFLYPYYQEYAYMQECLQENHTQSWCEQTWKELEALD